MNKISLDLTIQTIPFIPHAIYCKLKKGMKTSYHISYLWNIFRKKKPFKNRKFCSPHSNQKPRIMPKHISPREFIILRWFSTQDKRLGASHNIKSLFTCIREKSRKYTSPAAFFSTSSLSKHSPTFWPLWKFLKKWYLYLW